MQRQIKRILKGHRVSEGAGVILHRAFSNDAMLECDPFLMLDDFRSDNPQDYLRGFPWHPHRGIETITYVTKGDVEHGDSMGNAGVIGSGDVQWMTAGSGVIHQEMPQGDANGAMYGFQLWTNLPQTHKMTPPRYRSITAAEIPEVTLADGVRAKIIAGALEGVQGPVKDVVAQPQYMDFFIPEGVTHTIPARSGDTVIIYVTAGHGRNREDELVNRDLAIFTDGDSLSLSAGQGGLRFLFLSGRPLHEPIAWRGPIVMNTEEELRQAFREFEEGSFIKDKAEI